MLRAASSVRDFALSSGTRPSHFRKGSNNSRYGSRVCSSANLRFCQRSRRRMLNRTSSLPDSTKGVRISCCWSSMSFSEEAVCFKPSNTVVESVPSKIRIFSRGASWPNAKPIEHRRNDRIIQRICFEPNITKAYSPSSKQYNAGIKNVADFIDAIEIELRTYPYKRRSTSAEFFDPNPTQLQTACSITARRPASGT